MFEENTRNQKEMEKRRVRPHRSNNWANNRGGKKIGMRRVRCGAKKTAPEDRYLQ